MSGTLLTAVARIQSARSLPKAATGHFAGLLGGRQLGRKHPEKRTLAILGEARTSTERLLRKASRGELNLDNQSHLLIS